MGLYLVWEIGDKEFRIIFQKEIEDWMTYKDQYLFGERIEKIIRSEMEKYHIKDDAIKKLIKDAFPEPEYIIIYPD